VIRFSRRHLVRCSIPLAGLTIASGCGLVPRAHQQPRTPRVGFLTLRTVTDGLEAFRDGLRELGYIEGQTITIEERRAESNEQFPALAAELVGLPVDLIVTAGAAPSTGAVMAATRTIPIVFAATPDPVGSGFVASLARPGGNVTGLSNQANQITGKRLELLREIVPGVSRIVHLTDTVASEATGGPREARQAAELLGMQFLTPTIHTAADLPAALEMAIHDHADAVSVAGPALMLAERERIVDFAMSARLPLIAQDGPFAEAGGLLSYGPSRLDLYRRAAVYVDKILKGAKPADLPVEQPTVFDLVINLKTAQTLGLTIPQSVMQQATEVIH
jgi:putative ABC transport system substrate-binding protein